MGKTGETAATVRVRAPAEHRDFRGAAVEAITRSMALIIDALAWLVCSWLEGWRRG